MRESLILQNRFITVSFSDTSFPVKSRTKWAGFNADGDSRLQRRCRQVAGVPGLRHSPEMTRRPGWARDDNAWPTNGLRDKARCVAWATLTNYRWAIPKHRSTTNSTPNPGAKVPLLSSARHNQANARRYRSRLHLNRYLRRPALCQGALPVTTALRSAPDSPPRAAWQWTLPEICTWRIVPAIASGG